MTKEKSREEMISMLRAASLPPLRVLYDRTDRTLRACAVQRKTLNDVAAERPLFSADEMIGQTAEQIAAKRQSGSSSSSSPSSSSSSSSSLSSSSSSSSTSSSPSFSSSSSGPKAGATAGAASTRATAMTKSERYKAKLEEWREQKLAKYDSSTEFREARRAKGYGTRGEYEAFLTKSIETKLKSIG